jgi:hypothetical protein
MYFTQIGEIGDIGMQNATVVVQSPVESFSIRFQLPADVFVDASTPISSVGNGLSHDSLNAVILNDAIAINEKTIELIYKANTGLVAPNTYVVHAHLKFRLCQPCDCSCACDVD